MERLKVTNLGPIQSAEVEFGDLTILVGPQASGKTLFLQMFKLAKDKKQVYNRLKTYGYYLNKNSSVNQLLDHYLGRGVASVCFRGEVTEVSLNSQGVSFAYHPENVAENVSAQVFYVPAQRILSISEGRFRNFNEFDTATPYVLKDFSEVLRLFSQHGLGDSPVIFPIKNRLKGALKRSLQQSVFYKGRMMLQEREGQKKLMMKIGRGELPFMALSAGQKEFMPLLMAFYCLTGPPTPIINKDQYEYVIIEEPEMGLHPKAIVSVLLEIMELIRSGKKVIVSTHSPVILDFAWGFNNIKKTNLSQAQELDVFQKIFDVKGAAGIAPVFEGLLKRTVNTYFFGRVGRGEVVVKDITSLDAWSEDPEVAEWGGLTSFSNVMSDLVASYVD